jgi:hypothetical protein
MPSKFFVRGLNGQFGGSAPTSVEFSGVTIGTTGVLDGTNLVPKYGDLAISFDATTTNGLLDKTDNKKIDANRGAQFKSYCEKLISEAEQTFKKNDIEEANKHFDEITKWVALQQASGTTSENNYIIIMIVEIKLTKKNYNHHSKTNKQQ